MFDTIFETLTARATGKELPSLLEELTGISAKTWRKPGGPKRPQTQKNAKENARKWLLQQLQAKGEYTEQEALEIYAKRAASDGHHEWFSQYVKSFNVPGKFEWSRTEGIAKAIDEAASYLLSLRINGDLDNFKSFLLSDFDTPPLKQWLVQFDEFAGLQAKTQVANDWSELLEPSAVWVTQCIFRLLACWDVEFTSNFLRNSETGYGMQPQPLFQLLLPTLNPKVKPLPNGQYPSRALFQLPLSKLLDFTFCLAHRHRLGTWPAKQMITRTHIAAWGGTHLQGDGISEQPLAKIKAGSRSVTADEFAEIWLQMCGLDSEGKAPMPPLPCYFAAQMWTILFTGKTIIRNVPRVTTLTIIDPGIYRYWWDYYYQEAKAKGTVFGTIPWPTYFKAS